MWIDGCSGGQWLGGVGTIWVAIDEKPPDSRLTWPHLGAKSSGLPPWQERLSISEGRREPAVEEGTLEALQPDEPKMLWAMNHEPRLRELEDCRSR